MENFDTVILGGGASGCACAYMCAKLGLNTLLIEKNNYLGGLMTGGLVVPVMKSSVKNYNCDFYKKLVEYAKKYHAQITYKDGNDGWFNPELMKIVLVELLSSRGIKNNLKILFESDIKKTVVKKRMIEKIDVSNGILSIPIKSKYYVDATGSGILANISGCEFLDDNQTKQQNSLRFILGNVDIEKFCKFIKSVDDDENITNTYRNETYTNNELHFTTASTWEKNRKWALDKYLKQGVKDKVLKDFDRSYFQIFSVAGGFGQVAFNCPRINNYNDSPMKASNELIEGYKAIYRLFNFVKNYFPGFKNAIITNIATITGVREERRIKPKYLYTGEDLINGKKFKNPLLSANYPIDIHSNNKNKTQTPEIKGYQLPIESAMSNNIDNLFAIGKLIGAEFCAHSALRVQKSCMSMGEGVAKYIAQDLKN